MFLKQYILLLGTTFLLNSSLTVAQTATYKIFSLKENNKPCNITTLLKNSQGYIFAGSTNGLYKFDGIRFSKITTSDNNVQDTVTAIFENRQHQLWIGFKSGHLAISDGNKLHYYNPEEGTPQKAISCFIQDKSNNIWFGTQGEGIYYISNNRMYLVDEENGLSDLNIHSLSLTEDGHILAATDQGINLCKINGLKKEVTTIGPKDGLPDYMVSSITTAKANNFWVGLQDKGFCFYNYDSKKITIPPIKNNWKYGQINALLNTKNKLWLATQDSGLIQYENNELSRLTLPNEKANNVNSLLQDNQGNIWLATNEKLIRILSDELKQYPLYEKADFLGIHALLVDKENNFWVSKKNTITKYFQSNGLFKTKNYQLPELPDKVDITSLYQDKYQHIWIGTMGKGIFILDPLSGNYRHVKEVEKSGGANILSITGRDNTICVGGLEGAFVFFLEENNTNISSPLNFKNFTTNIGTNYVYYVYPDSKNRIWFATDGKGISVLENGKFTRYDNSSEIKDNHIYSITEDQKGNIWFSTSNAGIYKFNGNSFQNYNLNNGLSNLSISAIKTAIDGSIVSIHRNGLDILNPQTGSFFYINDKQGINELSQDMGCIAQSESGNIFIATSNGIAEYKADATYFKAPKTVIENIQLFLTDIEKKSPLNFSYDENNLTFYFTGLYYSDPENVFYQYKLQGFNNDWVATKDKNITFPKLDPGKYKFTIRSSLNNSFIGADESSVEFTIALPFWKRWWFVVSITLLLASLLYWYIRRRESALRRVQKLQQEKVQFQFEVLRNQINPHFLFNSFNTLISIIEENPNTAVNYVEQLSDFFRNIVNYRDTEIITLQEEIHLLQTFFYLQQKRYDTNLRLNITLTEEEKKQTFIPPLTLQLLMENAIKHNAVSAETPLKIDIFIANNTIVVSNNINPKLSKQQGAGMGLQNIINRYKLLSDKKVVITNNHKQFIVSLPILKQ